jgi:hypothetical protein
MLIEFFGCVVVICVSLAFLFWFTEETKIGRKLTSWLFNKITKGYFDNLE